MSFTLFNRRLFGKYLGLVSESNLKQQRQSQLPHQDFFTHDIFHSRRNQKIIDKATESTALVSTLFPKSIRDRMIVQQEQRPDDTGRKRRNSFFASQTKKVKHFLEGLGESIFENEGAQPIAEMFSDTTLIFINLVGFSAWSSVREPSQIFLLLESLYAEFDALAKVSVLDSPLFVSLFG